jgi:ribonuclease P protein component
MDGKDSLSQTNNFPRACRLGGRTALKTTALKGLKLSMDSVGISYINSDTTRFGISISRKAGKAVTRNRIRRLIREFLRQNKNLWPEKRWILIKIFQAPAQEKNLIAILRELVAKIK